MDQGRRSEVGQVVVCDVKRARALKNSEAGPGVGCGSEVSQGVEGD